LFLLLGLNLSVVHHLILMLLSNLLILLELIFIKLWKFNFINKMIESLFGIDNFINPKLERFVLHFLIKGKLIDHITD
jgi:hypothetical protein